MPRRPRGDAVERLTRHEQILEEDQEPDGRIDTAASVLGRQIGAKELIESQAFEDSVEDRKDADAARPEVVVFSSPGWPTWMGVLGSSGFFTGVAPSAKAGDMEGYGFAGLARRIADGESTAIPAIIIVRRGRTSRDKILEK